MLKMNFEEAKQINEELNKEVGKCEEQLKKYVNEKAKELGIIIVAGDLTPQIITQTTEYRKLNEKFNLNFKAMQTFGSYYVKAFKKELYMERDKKRKVSQK